MEFKLSNSTPKQVKEFFDLLVDKIKKHGSVIISVKPADTGRWGMARLWRAWMHETSKVMAARGVKMPLYIDSKGNAKGSRKFNAEDAHELFTHQWLGADKDGNRLSWSKNGSDKSRAATKGERLHAMIKHQEFCVERGINLPMPKNSEFKKLVDEQSQ